MPFRKYCNFTYSLLGIETWDLASTAKEVRLQFYLLPIRDWNLLEPFDAGFQGYCNFTYSLLGIETSLYRTNSPTRLKLQFYLLPIRDWNKAKHQFGRLQG